MVSFPGFTLLMYHVKFEHATVFRAVRAEAKDLTLRTDFDIVTWRLLWLAGPAYFCVIVVDGDPIAESSYTYS